jgi:LmbE family N-acetylglucosaminyl deacetylase
MCDAAYPLLERVKDRPPILADRFLARCQGICVVAPHPDDETLGCGVLLFEASRRGIPCRVVCVTDGARSHTASPTWPPERLAAERRRELSVAVRHLAPSAGIDWLGYPDCGVPKDEPIFEQAAARLHLIFEEERPSLVVTTWVGDPHIDHRHTNELVRAAVDRYPPAQLYEVPVWGRFRRDASEDAFADALLLAGGATAQAAKTTALACHRTQMTRLIDDDPDGFVMEGWMQRHFLTHPEIYLAA